MLIVSRNAVHRERIVRSSSTPLDCVDNECDLETTNEIIREPSVIVQQDPVKQDETEENRIDGDNLS